MLGKEQVMEFGWRGRWRFGTKELENTRSPPEGFYLMCSALVNHQPYALKRITNNTVRMKLNEGEARSEVASRKILEESVPERLSLSFHTPGTHRQLVTTFLPESHL